MMRRRKISSPTITLHTEPRLTVSVNNYFTPPGFNKAKKKDLPTNREVLNPPDLNSTHIRPVLNAAVSLKNRKRAEKSAQNKVRRVLNE